MNKFNDTTPKSKFEDVPEEILNDPVLRTALGMDPIPGMNTPADEKPAWEKATESNNTDSASDNTTATPDVRIFKDPVHPEFGELRILEINGQPWFIGKDVATALGYAKPLNAIAAHVEKDDSLKQGLTDSLGRKQETTIINESGLYSLILSSKLPSAKDFKHWVTSEVLPSIRKNGAYIRNQENLTPEEIVARGLIAAQNIINEKEKEIAVLNGRCGLLTQAVDEKQDIINAISRNVPAPTKRAMLNRVMRRKCPGLAQSRWTFLYGKFEEIYHMNLKARMKKYNADPSHKKCKTILEFIDAGLGMMDELYDLAVKLFVSDFKQLAKELHLICMTDEEYMSEDTLREILN